MNLSNTDRCSIITYKLCIMACFGFYNGESNRLVCAILGDSRGNCLLDGIFAVIERTCFLVDYRRLWSDIDHGTCLCIQGIKHDCHQYSKTYQEEYKVTHMLMN